MPAQNCYIKLQDASGLNTDSYQTDLETAACALIETFPEEFQDSFKVYDFGFYLHNEVMGGGFPSVFERMIASVATESPYYLIFGKQTDAVGIYTKFWVDLKLPETGSFECMTPTERAIYKNQVETKTALRYAEHDNSFNYYHLAEKEGIDLLKSFITKIVDCCTTDFLEENCSPCFDVNTLRDLMDSNGFISIAVDELTHTPKNILGAANEYAQIDIEIGEYALDVNDDVATFFNKVANKISNVKANIYFYDEFGEHCSAIQNLILGVEEDGATALRNEEEYLLQLDVIGTVGEDGSKYLHVRFKDRVVCDAGVEIGTIYLIFLEDEVEVNETQVKDYLIEFYEIIDVGVNVSESYPSNELEFQDINAIAFFGEPSIIISYAIYEYNNITELFTTTGDDWKRFRNTRSNAVEIAHRSGGYCFIKTQNRDGNNQLKNQELVNVFECDNFEHYLSFMCFHSTGHLSGILHNNGIEDDLGYMENGDRIIRMLENNIDYRPDPDVVIKELAEGEEIKIRDLVNYTKDTYPATVIKIWQRYIRVTSD